MLGHRMREGRVLVEGALAIARERDVVRSELRALFNLGYFDEVLDIVGSRYDRDGLELARRIGDLGWTRSFLAHLAQSDFVTGDWDTALDRAEQLREGPGADANILVQSAALIPTAAMLACRGDAAGARAMIAARARSRAGARCPGPRHVVTPAWPTWRRTWGTRGGRSSWAELTIRLSEQLAFGHPATKVGALACADAAIAMDDRETLEMMRAWIGGNAAGPPAADRSRALLAKLTGVLERDEAGFLAAEDGLPGARLQAVAGELPGAARRTSLRPPAGMPMQNP